MAQSTENEQISSVELRKTAVSRVRREGGNERDSMEVLEKDSVPIDRRFELNGTTNVVREEVSVKA
jgi:hypothetical protein